jgi:hypothetical protein
LVLRLNQETRPSGFEVKPLTNRTSGFEAKPLANRSSGFEVKPLTNHRPWFWGQTKKPALLVSSCTVQIAHNITRPPDRPAIEYLIYAWLSLILYTRSPTPATILITARNAAPVTCTPQDKQTRFFNKKDKGKTTEMSQIRIQTSPSQWLITIKPRNWPLGFLVWILIREVFCGSTPIIYLVWRIVFACLMVCR